MREQGEDWRLQTRASGAWFYWPVVKDHAGGAPVGLGDVGPMLVDYVMAISLFAD